MEALLEKVTYRQFREMDLRDDENILYELLNGEIVARNSPSSDHQDISGKLYLALALFVNQHGLGKVFYAPLDVVLDNFNAPQPDLLFIKTDRLFVLDNRDRVVEGAPDLIVEIISPSSVRRDRHQKMAIYEQFAIREYWLVDPANKTIEVFSMRENRYQLSAFAVAEGLVKSAVLEGFELEVATIF